MLNHLTGIISSVGRSKLLIKNLPRIKLNDRMSLYTWYYTRRALLDFGKRYTLRIFLYASLFFPVVILVITLMALQFFKLIGIQYNYYFMPCFLLTACVFYVLLLMAIAAANLNKLFDVHKDILLEISTSFREK